MDVGFDDKRIGALLLGGIWVEAIGFADNAVADRFDGGRFEQADIITNASRVEIDLVLPIADSHDLPHGPMLLSEVLQFVIIEIASQSYRREYRDVPIVQAFASAVAPRVLVDIL